MPRYGRAVVDAYRWAAVSSRVPPDFLGRAMDLLRRLRPLIPRNLRRRRRGWGASGHAAVRERLSDYLDGVLGRREWRQIEVHVRGCPSCRAFARTMSRTVALLGQLPTARMPAPARARLRERLAAEVREGVLVQ